VKPYGCEHPRCFEINVRESGSYLQMAVPKFLLCWLIVAKDGLRRAGQCLEKTTSCQQSILTILRLRADRPPLGMALQGAPENQPPVGAQLLRLSGTSKLPNQPAVHAHFSMDGLVTV
jgi:hypothetical protein